MSKPSKLKQVLEEGAKIARLDSFRNLITGLGTSRDKMQAMQIVGSVVMPSESLAALYATNDFAERIVSALPNEGLKKQLDWTNKDISDEALPEAKEALGQAWRDTGALKAVREAAIWGRLFGGAILIMGADDGQEVTEPLNLDAVKALRFLQVVDRRDVTIFKWYSDPLANNFGQPELYQVTYSAEAPGAIRSSVMVHESRCIRFDGADTTRRDRFANSGWDHSVLQRVTDVLGQADSNWASLCARMSDGSQGVFKIQGLIDMLAAGQEDTMRERMELVDMGRSITRSIILDAEKESFELVESTFEGWAVVIDKTWQRLAAAARMPVTVLLGMSPAGLNATGESDLVNWYDQVQAYQLQILAPRIDRLAEVVAKAASIDAPESWAVRFAPLWQESPKETSEVRKMQAETDASYISTGVLLPEEVALSRFGGETYSTETTIDTEMRKAQNSAPVQTEPTPTVTPEPPTTPATEPMPVHDSADGLTPERLKMVADSLVAMRMADAPVDDAAILGQFQIKVKG